MSHVIGQGLETLIYSRISSAIAGLRCLTFLAPRVHIFCSLSYLFPTERAASHHLAMRLSTYLAAAAALAPAGLAEVLSTNSRWIVDSKGDRYKLRCVNWAGHLEANVPEGLQHKPVAYIAEWIAKAGFNCVRLTYSIDMALSPSTPVSESFSNAGVVSGVGAAAMDGLYGAAVQQNPFLANASTLDTYGAVVDALGAAGVNVILDNHVSKAQWCCNLTDGNGWWDTAPIYVAANSQWFNTTNWLAGLAAMATFAQAHPSVVGMSLRNEMRAWPLLQDNNNHADYYNYVGQAADAIHAANPDLLVVIGGVDSANDFSLQRTTGPINTASFAGKAVWEFHMYTFSVGFDSSNCDIFTAELGAVAGYLLTQNEAYTGPLWLSEFGVAQNGANGSFSSGDQAYLSCLVGYMEGNDADWAVWAVQGDYYVREGQLSYVESYGLLDPTWTDWQNPTFRGALAGMWDVTQGPGI